MATTRQGELTTILTILRDAPLSAITLALADRPDVTAEALQAALRRMSGSLAPKIARKPAMAQPGTADPTLATFLACIRITPT